MVESSCYNTLRWKFSFGGKLNTHHIITYTSPIAAITKLDSRQIKFP